MMVLSVFVHGYVESEFRLDFYILNELSIFTLGLYVVSHDSRDPEFPVEETPILVEEVKECSVLSSESVQ